MEEKLVDVSDAEALLVEVSRLRAEVRRLEERISLLDTLAHQDALMDVPNRRGFMRQLEMLIARVSRYGDSAAMLFVDVDGLKLINDTLGHKAGDEALIQVADLLSGGVRKEDCVARLGGDEFGILLAHADEAGALETARRLIERIAAAHRQDKVGHGRRLRRSPVARRVDHQPIGPVHLDHVDRACL